MTRAGLFRTGIPFIAAGYLVLLALFGGGIVAWTPAYMLLTIATLFTAATVAWTDGYTALDRLPLAGRIALIGIAVLPFLQLVPLPPALWHAFPGQELRRATLTLVGLDDSWQPMTLDPAGTALSAIMAAGFVTLTALLLRMSDDAFAKVLDVALGVVLFGIALGALQVVSAGQFPRLHPVDMGPTMLGVYANKNHMGLVIACAMVLFGFVASRRIAHPRRRRTAVVGAVAFGLVCIITTNSRAALILGAIAAVAVLADIARAVAWRWRLAALAVVILTLAVILSSSAFEIVSSRIGDVDDDLRWKFTQWSWPLVERYWTTGSGAGSFVTLFNSHEQLAWVKPTYVNAIHNDYLQLVLETGLPGVLIAALLVASLTGCVIAARASQSQGARRGQMAFGLIVLALFALHSAVDYPLRRPACWVFLALAIVAIYRAGRTTPEVA